MKGKEDMTFVHGTSNVLHHARGPRLLRWWTDARDIDVTLMVLPQPSGGHSFRVRIGKDAVQFKSLLQARRYIRRYLPDRHV
jgi:hypothetical protein